MGWMARPRQRKGNRMIPQMQHFGESSRKLAAADRAFMALVNDPKNPIPHDDLCKLIARYPERYGRFAAAVNRIKGAPGTLRA